MHIDSAAISLNSVVFEAIVQVENQADDVARASGADSDDGAALNAELTVCLVRAWLEAFRTLLALPIRNLYCLLPPAAELASESESLGFHVAQEVRVHNMMFPPPRHLS